MTSHGGFDWPKIKGHPVATVDDPTTGLPICHECWNGRHAHPNKGCKVIKCMCGCYQGKSKGLSKLRYPDRDFAPNLPDMGGIDF